MTPYLWIFLLFTCVAINGLILLGLSAALRASGRPGPAVRRLVRSAGGLLFGWLALVAALGATGVFVASRDDRFPFIALAIGAPVALGIWALRRSVTVAEILAAVPQSWLIGLQGYRGLGAIFLVLHGLGLLPGAFALPAGIGDVLVALGALVMAGLWSSGAGLRESLAVFWNILGLADLVIAVGTGFLSAPTRFQLLALDAPNVLVGHYPLVLVPAFAVPLSIVLHLASLTKLARERPTAPLAAAGQTA
jgi:hypothetical protein